MDYVIVDEESFDLARKFCNRVRKNFNSMVKKDAEAILDELLEIMDMEDICENPDSAINKAIDRGILHETIESDVTYPMDNESLFFCNCDKADMNQICENVEEAAYRVWERAVLRELKNLIDEKCWNFESTEEW